MLNIILADSELEIVPASLRRHPSVISSGRKRGKAGDQLLLDSTLHHSAIQQFPRDQALRRGRPDIVHLCMNVFQDSELVRGGQGHLFIHTRGHKVLDIAPRTHPPRSYNRFLGLMEKLLHDPVQQSWPASDALITHYDMKLETLIARLGAQGVTRMALMHEGDGTSLPPGMLFSKKGMDVRNGEDIAVLVGGFPHGNFLSECVHDIPSYSISPMALTASAVIGELVVAYRDHLVKGGWIPEGEERKEG